MSKIESGTHVPNLILVFKLADALNVSAADLVQSTEVRLKKLRQQTKDPINPAKVEPADNA